MIDLEIGIYDPYECDGNQVLVQEDDTLEDEVLTLYFDYIYDSGGVLKITNKTFFESLDNNNENAYGFSQMADTWVFEDQLIFGFDIPSTGPVKASFQLSPSIRHQDFEHGDNFAFEYFDRRDLTQSGSPIDRRTMATRGQAAAAVRRTRPNPPPVRLGQFVSNFTFRSLFDPFSPCRSENKTGTRGLIAVP